MMQLALSDISMLAAFSVLLFIVCAAGVRAAWRRGFPSLDCEQRQTFALGALFFGEVALTAMWLGLYLYELHLVHAHAMTSSLAKQGQIYIWRLMLAHAAAMAIVAIGDVVSARVGDWLEIKRKGDG